MFVIGAFVIYNSTYNLVANTSVNAMMKHPEEYEKPGGAALSEEFLTAVIFKKLHGHDQAKNAIAIYNFSKINSCN